MRQHPCKTCNKSRPRNLFFNEAGSSFPRKICKPCMRASLSSETATYLSTTVDEVDISQMVYLWQNHVDKASIASSLKVKIGVVDKVLEDYSKPVFQGFVSPLAVGR